MNDNLIIAIEQLSDEMIIREIPNAPDHEFSRKFEKRMRRIIAGKYTPKIRITPKRITLKKLTICLVAAFVAIITLAMSVSAVREAIFSFLTQVFTTHTVVQSDIDEVAPETFMDFYEITADIDGYKLIDNYTTPSERVFVYDNGIYRIRFIQTIKKHYNIGINTEGYDIIPVYIGEYEGIYINMKNQKHEYLSYDNNSYVISIGVTRYSGELPIGQNALINIAKSVKKVEN
jgi:hypothetical protein